MVCVKNQLCSLLILVASSVLYDNAMFFCSETSYNGIKGQFN
jgi:hypothetical protein